MPNDTEQDDPNTERLLEQIGMSVENEKAPKWTWQLVATTTGYFNMAVGCFGFAFTLIAGLIWANIAIEIERGNLELNDTILNNGTTVDEQFGFKDFQGTLLSLLLMLALILFSLDIWTGCTLLLAASKSSDVQKCQAKCRQWGILTLILILLSSIMIPQGYTLWYVWLWWIYRTISFALGLLHVVDVQIKSNRLLKTKCKSRAQTSDYTHSTQGA